MRMTPRDSYFCKSCSTSKNPDHFHLASNSGWLALDGHRYCRTCKPCMSENNKRWSRKNKARRKDNWLKNRYGLSLSEREQMEMKSGGRCYACGTEPGHNNLHVDHCHDTGRVRGLLCRNCNSVLGYVYDSPEVLEYLAGYLRSDNPEPSPRKREGATTIPKGSRAKRPEAPDTPRG